MPTTKKPIEKAEIAVVEPRPSEVITLAGDLSSIVAAFEQYQTAVERLLTDSDYQNISGKKFKKKSAWRKLSTAFGITTEIVSRDVAYEEGKIQHAEFVVRATAPNGRSAEGWGGANIKDRAFSHDQDVAATAQTRATNRAISDLIGAGEVSAEEAEHPNTPSGAGFKDVNPETGEIIEESATEKQIKFVRDLMTNKVDPKTAGDAKRVMELAGVKTATVEQLSKQDAKTVIDYLTTNKSDDIKAALATEILQESPF